MAIILSKRKDFYGDMSQGSLIADEGVEGAGGGGEGSEGEGRHLVWRSWWIEEWPAVNDEDKGGKSM